METLLNGVTQARDALPISSSTSKRPKLVLKIAPDLEERQLIEIAEVIRNSGVDGVIVSNTTTQRPKHLISREPLEFLIHYLGFSSIPSANKVETGGLSGKPVKEFSLKALRTLRSQLPPSIPTIGCGGIFTGADALEFARAGASLVQVYTGFGYDGAGFCRRIKDELAEQLTKEGTTWGQVVKEAVDQLSFKPGSVESEIGQLVSQARELQGYLDKLEEKIEAPADDVKA